AKVAAEAEATALKQTAEVQEAHVAVKGEHETLAVTAHEYERVVAEGKSVRDQHEAAEKRVAELTAELAARTTAAESLATLEPEAEGLAAAEERLAAVQDVERGKKALGQVAVPDEQARPDEQGWDEGRR